MIPLDQLTQFKFWLLDNSEGNIIILWHRKCLRTLELLTLSDLYDAGAA
jgi:hypothetical protein